MDSPVPVYRGKGEAGLPAPKSDWESWKRHDRQEEEPCSEKDRMAVVQVLVPAPVPVLAVAVHQLMNAE